MLTKKELNDRIQRVRDYSVDERQAIWVAIRKLEAKVNRLLQHLNLEDVRVLEQYKIEEKPGSYKCK